MALSSVFTLTIDAPTIYLATSALIITRSDRILTTVLSPEKSICLIIDSYVEGRPISVSNFATIFSA